MSNPDKTDLQSPLNFRLVGVPPQQGLKPNFVGEEHHQSQNSTHHPSQTTLSPKRRILIVSLLGNLPYLCIVGQKQRTITFYKTYFEDFFTRQKDKVKDKIIWTFDLIEELPRVPETYLKHIENTDGLFEIRVKLASDIFRIFCFFDHGRLIVLANGFQKKTQKTPKKEIDKALKIEEEYESEKKKFNDT